MYFLVLDPCNGLCETDTLKTVYTNLEPVQSYSFKVSVKSVHLEISPDGINQETFWGSKPEQIICNTRPPKLTGIICHQKKNLNLKINSIYLEH